jgi:hypothetical protein
MEENSCVDDVKKDETQGEISAVRLMLTLMRYLTIRSLLGQTQFEDHLQSHDVEEQRRNCIRDQAGLDPCTIRKLLIGYQTMVLSYQEAFNYQALPLVSVLEIRVLRKRQLREQVRLERGTTAINLHETSGQSRMGRTCFRIRIRGRARACRRGRDDRDVEG